MKRTTTTVTLLPFAPHQQQHSLSWSQQRTPARSRLPSLLGASVPCIMSAPSPSQLFEVSRRPNTLRISPSIISEASCDTTSSSSSSSSSSSFPSVSPTSSSTSPPSLPPSPPPPSNRSLGKSRPLPQPPAPTERPNLNNNAAAVGQFRPRTPPPAWSPRETEPSFIPPTAARPTRPRVMLPPAPPQERQPPSESPRVPLASSKSLPFAQQLDGSVSSPVQPRVRRLPTRPVPPGPPSEDNTPIAPFGLPRWQADALTIPQDDTSMSPYDDRRAIDWDLIDEVMKHAG